MSLTTAGTAACHLEYCQEPSSQGLEVRIFPALMLALLAYLEQQARQLGPLAQAGCLVPLRQSLQYHYILRSCCPMHRCCMRKKCCMGRGQPSLDFCHQLWQFAAGRPFRDTPSNSRATLVGAQTALCSAPSSSALAAGTACVQMICCPARHTEQWHMLWLED